MSRETDMDETINACLFNCFGGSKREEWSDFRMTSDQSAPRVSAGTNVPEENRFPFGILPLKRVNLCSLSHD